MTPSTVGSILSCCIIQSTVARSSMPRGESKPSMVAEAHSNMREQLLPFTGVQVCLQFHQYLASLNQMRSSGSASARRLSPKITAVETIEQFCEIVREGPYLFAWNLKSSASVTLKPRHTALEEPSQLLHFKNGALDPQERIPAYHLGHQRTGRGQLFNTGTFGNILVFHGRLVNDGVDPIKFAQCRLNQRSDILPIEAAIPTSKWGDRNRMNVLLGELLGQGPSILPQPIQFGSLLANASSSGN